MATNVRVLKKKQGLLESVIVASRTPAKYLNHKIKTQILYNS